MLTLVVTVLAIFLMASILYQIKKLQPFFHKIDKAQLLPNYCFFAPYPYVNDFRVVFNTDDEGKGEWQELEMYQPFKLKRILWNPFKYYNKGMIDMCQQLIQENKILNDKERLKISSNHINIVISVLKYLSEQNIKPRGVKYAIVTSEGCDEIAIKHIIFKSNFQII